MENSVEINENSVIEELSSLLKTVSFYWIFEYSASLEWLLRVKIIQNTTGHEVTESPSASMFSLSDNGSLTIMVLFVYLCTVIYIYYCYTSVMIGIECAFPSYSIILVQMKISNFQLWLRPLLIQLVVREDIEFCRINWNMLTARDIFVVYHHHPLRRNHFLHTLHHLWKRILFSQTVSCLRQTTFWFPCV